MRSPFRRRHDGATEVHHHDTGRERDGMSLAKGPVLIIGTTLTVFGLAGLLFNSDFPNAGSQFPDGTAEGETFLGIEVNGWTNWLSIVAGSLLLFGLARHWIAKTMATIVGLGLAAASVISLIDGEDVLGLAATNGWTKLAMAIAAGALLITALLPRTRGRDRDVHLVDRDPDRIGREERHVVPAEPVGERDVAERDFAERERTGRFSREESPTEVRPGDRRE